jgi:peroxiredoxin
LITLAGCAAAPPPVQHVETLGVAATLPLVTPDGQTTNLGEALGGRVALVSLWATWCESCRDELAALSRLAARAGDRGALVLGVAVGERRDTVAAFVAAHALPYRTLVDEDFHFADTLGQRRVPTTLVVDRTGQIRFIGGALDEQALSALRHTLDAAVAGR